MNMNMNMNMMNMMNMDEYGDVHENMRFHSLNDMAHSAHA